MKQQILKPNIRELTLEHGFSYPTDTELIMMILGSGTKYCPIEILAQQIEQIISSCNREQIYENLINLPGMGKSKALTIMAALELGRRRNSFQNAKIKMPSDILPFVLNFSTKKKEHFLCICLNGSHEIIQIKVISIGTDTKTILNPKEIFLEAIKENAAGIIICHNHPSGNCTPSKDDINTTEQLIKGARILGIELLDHIIFSQNSYYSFVENKLLFTES